MVPALLLPSPCNRVPTMSISPTPWTIEPHDRPYLRIAGAPSASGMSQVVALVNGIDRDDNAALIVAAPELAAAVRAGDWVRAAEIVRRLDAGA